MACIREVVGQSGFSGAGAIPAPYCHIMECMSLNRDDISDRLAAVGYIADRDLATALWLMDFLKRPLLLEGEAGVGKTEVAKALAAVHGAELNSPAVLRGARSERRSLRVELPTPTPRHQNA